MTEKTKIYFASDQHFGAPDKTKSRERETIFLRWLDTVEKDGHTLFLLGDLFDFWFEYKYAVPKGFVRVLGKLATLKDKGLKIHFFVGNHDLWVKDYFQKELGFEVYHRPKLFSLGDQKFFIGHGDGLGPSDKGYKRMKKVFTNPLAMWCYRWLHPDLGIALARYLSLKNKLISGKENPVFLGKEKEWLYQYAVKKQQENGADYFIFGHRHLPLEIPLEKGSVYINTGDWIQYFSYGVFDGKNFELKYFEDIFKP